MEKGQYGYLKWRQQHEFRMTLFCAGAVLILALIGFFIWHTRFNLLMIPAMLCVIPMANYLVSYLAVAKYHTPPENWHEAVKVYEDAGMLLSDLVVVDEKGARNGLDFAVLYKNGVIGLMSKERDNKDSIEITINDTLKRRGIPMRIKVYRDWTDFQARLAEVTPQIEPDMARRIELTRDAVLSVSI